MSTLGDGPIEDEYREKMRHVAAALDNYLNEGLRGEERHTGFVLLVFPVGEKECRCNYISNGCDRGDIVTMFKEQIARFEGQAEARGRALTLTGPALAIWRSRRWALFPTNADKSPACRHGYRDASTDETTTRALFDHAPNAALISVATGPVSGVSAIDIDPDAGIWFEQRRNLFRPTWAQRTPRGGWHLLYEHPPGLRCSAGKIRRGVDIRAEGGSCIIWGPGYTLVDGRDPAPFPGWILAAIARADAMRVQRASLRSVGEAESVETLAQFVARSREGERNARLFWAACRAGGKAAALLPFAVETGLQRHEAERTILSAMRVARRA